MSSSLPPQELLEHGEGDRVRRGRSARTGALVAGGALLLAAAAGGTWAAMSFLTTGPQPAEALPGTTIGYLSIDLDPAGGQKVEALRTLREFEAFREHVGLDTDDDVRRFLVEETFGRECDALDYDDHVEPWLGDRAALAAVPVGGGEPVPVVVVAVRDAGAARTGLQRLAECAGDEQVAWAIDDDWAVVAEDQGTADRVAAEAADSPLAEDEDFTRWTQEAGDAGIATLYAAPEAGAYLADAVGPLLGLGAAMPFSYGGEPAAPPGGEQAGSLTSALEEFGGMAATLRFADGAVELEVAAGSAATEELEASGDLDELVGELPDDTAAALGLALGEGWSEALTGGLAGSGGDPEGLGALVEQMTGIALDLPEDLETLTDGGLALSVGGALDPEAFFSGSPEAMPIAVTMRGDADEIGSVLDEVSGSSPLARELLGRTVEGDTVVVGPDESWRQEVAGGGSLGSTDRFRSVVEDLDGAAGVLYLDLDSRVVAGFADGDDEAARNLEPLSALGITSSLDGDVSRTVLRLATD